MSGDRGRKGSRESSRLHMHHKVDPHGVEIPDYDEVTANKRSKEINWSKLRETAPDLYVVSIIIMLFGIFVVQGSFRL